MDANNCPRANELEALALGHASDESVRQHAKICLTCRQIVTDLRCQAQLIDALREARAEALDDRTRAEVLAICRAACDGASR